MILNTINALKNSKIAVIFGGDTTNETHFISQPNDFRGSLTYEAVSNDIKKTLELIGFKHVELFQANLSLNTQLQQFKPKLAWLNGTGMGGIDSMAYLPALMDNLGVPHQFHSPFISSLLDRKHETKERLKYHGIDVADDVIIHTVHEFTLDKITKFNNKPIIVKPVIGRASRNITYVNSGKLDDIYQAVKEQFYRTPIPIMVEQYLPGNEYSIAVLGNVIHKRNQFIVLEKPYSISPVKRLLGDLTISPSKDKTPLIHDFFCLEENADIVSQLHNIAQKSYTCLGAESIIRIDLRMNEMGKLCVLEANPKPDLAKPTNTTTSIVSVGLHSVGMDYEDLILSILGNALHRYAVTGFIV